MSFVVAPNADSALPALPHLRVVVDREDRIADDLGFAPQALDIELVVIGGVCDAEPSFGRNHAQARLSPRECDFGLDARAYESPAVENRAHFGVCEARAAKGRIDQGKGASQISGTLLEFDLIMQGHQAANTVALDS
ncbi:hypothetical protein [Mesorhizobium sp. M0488]